MRDEKWSFELLYRTWNSLVTRHRKSHRDDVREIFARERDALIARSGWEKLEFYTAIDEYHRIQNT